MCDRSYIMFLCTLNRGANLCGNCNHLIALSCLSNSWCTFLFELLCEKSWSSPLLMPFRQWGRLFLCCRLSNAHAFVSGLGVEASLSEGHFILLEKVFFSGTLKHLFCCSGVFMYLNFWLKQKCFFFLLVLCTPKKKQASFLFQASAFFLYLMVKLNYSNAWTYWAEFLVRDEAWIIGLLWALLCFLTRLLHRWTVHKQTLKLTGWSLEKCLHTKWW